MNKPDFFQRFLFENLGIRGELVRLEDAWTLARNTHDYPPAVASLLGQALAGSVLLSGTIKFQGSLILQVQGPGPITTLVAQATNRLTIRGLAHWRDTPTGSTLNELVGDGRLVMTIQQEGREPYQGIVALEGDTLAESIERYFAQSEQLPTRLWLFADGQRAGGLFVQALPKQHWAEEDWRRIGFLAETLSERELLDLPAEDLLFRLFHEERVRLLEAEPVAFRCNCSRERIGGVLTALGQVEIQSILADHVAISVACEFCNRRYAFDSVDIGALFGPGPRTAAPATRQ